MPHFIEPTTVILTQLASSDLKIYKNEKIQKMLTKLSNLENEVEACRELFTFYNLFSHCHLEFLKYNFPYVATNGKTKKKNKEIKELYLHRNLPAIKLFLSYGPGALTLDGKSTTFPNFMTTFLHMDIYYSLITMNNRETFNQIKHMYERIEFAISMIFPQHKANTSPLISEIETVIPKPVSREELDRQNVEKLYNRMKIIVPQIEKSFAKLYGYKSSPLYNFEHVKAFIYGESSFDEIGHTYNSLNLPSNSIVIYGKNTYKSLLDLSSRLLVKSTHDLTEIRNFNHLVIDDEEKAPEILIEKNRIIAKFDSNIKDAIKNLPLLRIETALKNYRKQDAETTSMLINSAKLDNSPLYFKDYVIISRNLTEEQLPLENLSNITLINTNEEFLAEAENKLKIFAIHQLLTNVLPMFIRQSSSHIKKVSKESLHSSITKLQNWMAELKLLLESFTASITDSKFAFAENELFIEISKTINETLSGKLLHILTELDQTNETDYQNLSDLQKNISAYETELFSVKKKLSSCQEKHYPETISLGNELENTYISCQKSLEQMAETIKKLKEKTGTLKRIHNFPAIQDNILNLENKLFKANKTYNECMRPTNTNQFRRISITLNCVQDLIQKAKIEIKMITDTFDEEERLINNAALTSQKKMQTGGNYSTALRLFSANSTNETTAPVIPGSGLRP